MQIFNTLTEEMVTVCFNENGAMFTFEVDNGSEITDWCSARGIDRIGHNQAWILKEYLNMFVSNGIVSPVMDGPNLTIEPCDDSTMCEAVLCDIIHEQFNDDGYSPFGDFSRGRLSQQCQYSSRYIEGRIEGYPALGDGLRFNNGMGYNGKVRQLDSGDYHSIRIHRDDMDEFERRYKEYRKSVTML